MSLVGFKAGNHPQQTKKKRGDPEKDERYTRLSYFEPLHATWHFTVDAAGCPAAPVCQRIGRWWDKESNGLLQNWDGERVWCNPPYSNIYAWVAKAWDARALVAMLLPANRTEQPWWQDLVEPYRDRPETILRVRFEGTRLGFGNPLDPTGEKRLNATGTKRNSSPPFGCVLLMWTSARRDSLFQPHNLDASPKRNL